MIWILVIILGVLNNTTLCKTSVQFRCILFKVYVSFQPSRICKFIKINVNLIHLSVHDYFYVIDSNKLFDFQFFGHKTLNLQLNLVESNLVLTWLSRTWLSWTWLSRTLPKLYFDQYHCCGAATNEVVVYVNRMIRALSDLSRNYLSGFLEFDSRRFHCTEMYSLSVL